MAVFSDSDILTILRDQNPWWVTGSVPAAMEKPFHRSEYYETTRVFFHTIRRFPVLSGLRRVPGRYRRERAETGMPPKRDG